jgi:hypothetical protein
MIEGACSDCDVIGIDAVNEFERHLTELRAFCNERKKNQDTTSKDDMYISRMVPDLTIHPDSLYYAFKVDMSGQFLATPITRWASAL